MTATPATYRTHLYKKLYMIGDIDGILEEVQIEVGNRLTSILMSHGIDPKTVHLTVSATVMGRIDGTKEVRNVDTGVKENATGLDAVRFDFIIEAKNTLDGTTQKAIEQAISSRLLPG